MCLDGSFTTPSGSCAAIEDSKTVGGGGGGGGQDKSNNQTAMIAGIIIGVAAAGAIVGYIVYRRQKGDAAADQTENLMSGI